MLDTHPPSIVLLSLHHATHPRISSILLMRTLVWGPTLSILGFDKRGLNEQI